jgi:hypothetical protein
MPIKAIVLGMLSGLVAHQLLAGDAVVTGYNSDGVWTGVTYNRSSTPKGGLHYREATQAGMLAELDLHLRGRVNPVRTRIIDQSDRTGYVTVARGKSPRANSGVTVIGRGKSQAEADQSAIEKLKHTGDTENERILYRYFSYGDDSASSPSSKRPADPAG